MTPEDQGRWDGFADPSIVELAERMPGAFTEYFDAEQVSFLHDLQLVHDDLGPEATGRDMEFGLRNVAAAWGLTVPGDEE